jgi:hypothetical protein
MSVEADFFKATDFQGGNSEVEWSLFSGGTVDDAFWAVSVVAQGTNNAVELHSYTDCQRRWGEEDALLYREEHHRQPHELYEGCSQDSQFLGGNQDEATRSI